MNRDEQNGGRQPTNEDAKPLPPGLDLLWGRRERGRRGPKPGLSVEAIVEAAIAIGDTEGLDAVSMARVAAAVGYTTMSLYRYVSSKDELLQLMWNASAQGAEELVLEGDDWREQMRSWAMAQREMLDRHQWITEMPMAAPPLAPNSLTFVERGLEALAETPISDADKLRLIGLVSSYTLGEARMSHDAARAARARDATDDEPLPQWTYEGLLRELVDEQQHPQLHRIAWSGLESDGETHTDEEQEFFFGLDRILDGIQALIDRGAQPTN